jgi:predicted amidophosphoribosyltransferase
VIPTGGTMKEVAKVLKKGGARWVGGWALAG